MKKKPEGDPVAAIQGQILRLSRHRVVAIYLRQRMIWVADFIDGHGTLVDANTWFRFNCATPENKHALRRMALESAVPLSAELVERIETLHRVAVVEKTHGAPGSVEAASVRRSLSHLARTAVRRARR